MKTGFLLPLLFVCVWLSFNAAATVHYVDLNCTNPVSPYTNWVSAATNIQDAIDVADPGDQILVTNGVYQTGGRVVPGFLTNRVAITKPLIVQSVNGPAVTRIQGNRNAPYVPFGSSSARCAYVTNGAMLTGFTLTNGATQNSSGVDGNGAGVWCESTDAVVSNCVLVYNMARTFGGGSYSGTLVDCTFVGNSSDGNGGGAYLSALVHCSLTGGTAGSGGGGYSCTLTNCTVSSNKAGDGGGVYNSTAYNCTISNNRWGGQGGGASSSTLYHCTVSNNLVSDHDGGSTTFGGGALFSTLYDCTVSGNSAGSYGGGTHYSTLSNCLVIDNTAGTYGGGAMNGTLNNCTIAGNVAQAWSGGGAASATLNNCMIIGNTANHSGGGASSCTLDNCVVISNSAGTYGGGGTRYGTLNNCTVVGNSAPKGGGVSDSVLKNCIVFYNLAPSNPNYHGTATVDYSCTTPLPTSGTGNITNEPLFINKTAGNLRLETNSPCINIGNHAYVTNSTDLDGNPRIVGGTVDVGAYECQSPALLAYYTWLLNYGLPTDAALAYTNSDGDGANNWQEYLADTSPLDANDFLCITNFTRDGAYNELRWSSKSTRLYRVERLDAFDGVSAWETIITNATPGWNNVGFDNTGPQYFYRIQAVQP
jgi:hypothetical protein